MFVQHLMNIDSFSVTLLIRFLNKKSENLLLVKSNRYVDFDKKSE